MELTRPCTRHPGRAATTRSGVSSRRIEALSARCSRRSITPTEVSVGRIGNSTMQHAVLDALGHPVAGVGEDLGHPRGSAAAPRRTNPVIPRSRAASARCSSSSWAMPAALVGVLDQEGDLGLVVLEPVVAADADHLLAER